MLGNSSLYQSCYNYTQNYIDKAPESLKNVKFASSFFVQQVTKKELNEFALRGIGMSLAFSFIILLLISCNVIIAFFAVISMGIITASVITIMVFLGYELVITESVSIIILTGLSVDYLLHLSQSYVFAP